MQDLVCFGSAVGPEGNIIGSCILHCRHEVTTNRACYQFEIADTELTGTLPVHLFTSYRVKKPKNPDCSLSDKNIAVIFN